MPDDHNVISLPTTMAIDEVAWVAGIIAASAMWSGQCRAIAPHSDGCGFGVDVDGVRYDVTVRLAFDDLNSPAERPMQGTSHTTPRKDTNHHDTQTPTPIGGHVARGGRHDRRR